MGDKRPKERDCPLSNCTTTVNKPSQIDNLLIQPISAPFLGLSDKLFLKDTASHIARKRPIIETSSGELQSCALQRHAPRAHPDLRSGTNGVRRRTHSLTNCKTFLKFEHSCHRSPQTAKLSVRKANALPVSAARMCRPPPSGGGWQSICFARDDGALCAYALHFGVNILCGLIAYCYQPKKPSLYLEKDLAQYAKARTQVE